MRPGGPRGGGERRHPLVRGSLKAGGGPGVYVGGGREYLTGFHKRKVERRKAALEEIKRKLKEEQRKMKEEVPTHTSPPRTSVGEGCLPAPAMAGEEWGRPRGPGRGAGGVFGLPLPRLQGDGRLEGQRRRGDLFPSLSGTRST